MRCQEAFEAMSARFDGELASAETQSLTAHLAGCAECRARETELAVVARRLRGAAAEQPAVPAPLQARISRAISPRPPARRAPFVFSLAFFGATATLAAFTMVARARPVAPSTSFAVAPQTSAPLESPTHNSSPSAASLNGLTDGCRQQLGDSPIAIACATGGVPAAKVAMKDLVERARARGFDLSCRTCHRDESTWELGPEARERLREALIATGT